MTNLKSPAVVHKKPAASSGVHLTPPKNPDDPFPGEPFLVRLVFLDIDGVLNSDRTAFAYGARPNVTDDGEVSGFAATDLVAAELITEVCNKANAHIVISSSWRKLLSHQSLKEYLEIMGIKKDLIIGTTDNVGPFRGDEIMRFVSCLKRPTGRKWLEGVGCLQTLAFPTDRNIQVESYVIIDDLGPENFLEHQHQYLVQVDPKEGFSLKNALQALHILRGDSEEPVQ